MHLMRAVANENINFIVRLYDELSHSLLLFLSLVFNKIYGNMSVFNCLRSYWFLMCHFKRIASFNSIIICISIYLHIRVKSKFRTFIYVDLFAYNLHNIKNGIEIGMLRKCVKWRPQIQHHSTVSMSWAPKNEISCVLHQTQVIHHCLD